MRELLDRIPSGSSLPLGDQILIPAGIIVPMLIAFALWVSFPPDRRRSGAIALATTWNAVWLLVFNVVAVQVGWWSFGDAGPAIAGVPVALWLGWVALWGTAASQSPLRPSVTLLVLALLDLIYMPLFGGAVELGRAWLVGEVFLLAFVAWPGLLLAHWTNRGERLIGRTIGQGAMFSAMLLFVVPAISTSVAGNNLALDVSTWTFGALFIGLGIASLPAVIAIHDFYANGATPWPWDTTLRPVRSGPYRYLRSPMQLSGFLVLVWATFLYGRVEIGAAAISSILYARIFCELEERDLRERFGVPWTRLVANQGRWIPSMRPSPHGSEATIWIDAGCETCSPLGDFLAARAPVNLHIENAIQYREGLSRTRYEREDGQVFNGMQAVGAALEHLHLGWALIGWLLRAPVLWRLWQLAGDASGFGPTTRLLTATPAARPLDLPWIEPGGGTPDVPRKAVS